MDESKILIVEDDLAILDLYKTELEHRNYRVFSANTGGQGLTIAKKEKPALILLDIMLPGMDGFTFIKTLRENPEAAQIPIIIISNLGTSENFRLEGERLGVEKYLVKYKVTVAEVAEAVAETLSAKKNG